MTAATPEATASLPARRVAVWADPEVPGPPLYRSDIVDGHHRNFSYGWTWWSARHVVLLPAGMSFIAALTSERPIEVTVVADVSPLATGMNEVSYRVDADWSSARPEQRLIEPSQLCQPVQPRTPAEQADGAADERPGEDLDEEGGSHGDYFRKMRDIHRRTHKLPRAVVRSDAYGRTKHHLLVHDWPDGTFFQGGTVTRDDQPRVFIEAFPRTPATLLRGEGATYAEAEDRLWARWQRILGCASPTGTHQFETRGYRNGAGFCRHCDLFQSKVFDLREIGSVCVVCAEPYYGTVRHRGPDGEWLRGARDMVCRAHLEPGGSSEWDYLRDIEAHLSSPDDAATPLPDVTWMLHRLPEGFPTVAVDWKALREAYGHALRDHVDRLVDQRVSADADPLIP